MRPFLIALTAACAFAICLDAQAWSEAGHKIIASIAFRQLTPRQQARIVAILKKHPRYAEDFAGKMPEELTTEAEQNEWIFQQAAIWPDLARGFRGDDNKAYHRPTWHYINIPHFLTPEDQTAMESSLKLNTSLDPPDEEKDDLNVVQAIRLARRLSADSKTADEKKAVMMCWIFHDIGDIHQPLHSSALFSKNLFPTGDRGGNSIKTDQRQNLHALWDQLLGDRAEFHKARNRAIELVNDEDKSKLGFQAAKQLDEKTWLDESHELAVSAAYGPEVSGHLRSVVDQTEAPPLRLSETYLKAAGGIAEERVVQSGYRLGEVLKQIVGARARPQRGALQPSAAN
jgi:S1/P1 Nuclease